MDERRIISPADNFINSYASSYPPSSRYFTDRRFNSVQAHSSHNFRSSRPVLIERYLGGESKNESMEMGLFAEQIVCLALQPPINSLGFDVHLAPQDLEKSTETQKGVDILIADGLGGVHLGIDVKARAGKSVKGQDGHGWNAHLKTPFIYLALGNWTVDLRQEEDVDVKRWLSEYAVPYIQRSGSIPRLNEFREYLLKRIEKSIYGYSSRLLEPAVFHKDTDPQIPQLPEDKRILYEKLTIMQSLFQELVLSM